MKTYLGDSVYAEVEDGMLKLTTENGMGPTNTIYLEWEVYKNLGLYVEALRTPGPDPDGDAAPTEGITL